VRLRRLLVLGGLVLAAALPEAAASQQGPTFFVPEDRLVEGSAALSPRIVLFGDTVRARVDLVFSRDDVDPDSVRISTSFPPWEVVGEPQRRRRDAGEMTHLRTTYVIRCLTGPCVPSGQVAPLEFSPARVSFAGPGGEQATRGSTRVVWPVLTVYSRFASASADRQSSTSPWRADVVTMPAVSYRVAPGLLLVLALAGGALLTLGGLALVYVAWPRREPAPPPEPEPEPLPLLTPLEQALELLEDSAREDGTADRRRALELVAEVLAERGDSDDLVRSARVLAWSEDDPAVEETSGLAAQVRPLVEEDRASEEIEETEASEEGRPHVG
jgi:hypothetical protein